ncbi:Signal recognition particle subunit SRP72 [Aphelenchoides fujianensis]|nr:Signal recognition particle subunit SRP72 [Aphelenchoides fujianensis]
MAAKTQQPTAAIRAACTEIAEGEADGDFEAVLKATNKLSKLNPRDLPVQRCKLTALIQLGQFEEALKMIARIPEHQLGNTTVEKAYIYYRQNKNDEALQLLADIDEKDAGGQDELDTYEQLFNHACHLAAAGRFVEALEAVEQAEAKCRQWTEAEGWSAKETNEELAVILLEKGYVLQQLGRKEDAFQVYTALHKQKPSDSLVSTPLNANLAALKKRIQLEAAGQEGEPKAPVDSAGMSLRKHKKKRKPRLPKNYDPNVQPDPERWLPKRERAAYKKKLNKKFKDRDIGRGTQGGTSAANADKIDYSKQAPKEATQSPKPTPPQAEGPRQRTQAGRQQQKKKKKGGRW